MTPDQTAFRAALLNPADPVPDGLTDGQSRPAGRRFSVYRNNVAVSLTEALETGFPVIAKLLGDANFKPIAGMFLRAHPPTSPLMMHYGDAFPAFLEGFKPLEHLGYLGDVARLELALRRSYHAADASAIDPARLQDMNPETLMQAHVHLAPALEVVRSGWPILDIWHYNMTDGAPKPKSVAQDVLITRVEFDPAPHALPPGGAIWIEALIAGHSFGDAHDTTLQHVADFDLGAALGLLLSGGAITALSPENDKGYRP